MRLNAVTSFLVVIISINNFERDAQAWGPFGKKKKTAPIAAAAMPEAPVPFEETWPRSNPRPEGVSRQDIRFRKGTNSYGETVYVNENDRGTFKLLDYCGWIGTAAGYDNFLIKPPAEGRYGLKSMSTINFRVMLDDAKGLRSLKYQLPVNPSDKNGDSYREGAYLERGGGDLSASCGQALKKVLDAADADWQRPYGDYILGQLAIDDDAEKSARQKCDGELGESKAASLDAYKRVNEMDLQPRAQTFAEQVAYQKKWEALEADLGMGPKSNYGHTRVGRACFAAIRCVQPTLDKEQAELTAFKTLGRRDLEAKHREFSAKLQEKVITLFADGVCPGRSGHRVVGAESAPTAETRFAN